MNDYEINEFEKALYTESIYNKLFEKLPFEVAVRLEDSTSPATVDRKDTATKQDIIAGLISVPEFSILLKDKHREIPEVAHIIQYDEKYKTIQMENLAKEITKDLKKQIFSNKSKSLTI